MTTPLPIDGLLSSICDSLKENQNLVLTATPGAGKTTRLPPALLKVVSGKILVAEPRRMAAVGACDRVGLENDWRVGSEVGYQVRFDSRVQERTRLVYLTDALLLRRMIDDPELKGVDLVILDEFHERNLNQDLLLGSLRELQQLGREIKILVMSATLDVQPLLDFLSPAVHVDVPGTVFPLEIRHSTTPLKVQTDGHFFDRVVQAISTAAVQTAGDILVFLPGTGEIARTAERLEALKLSRQVVSLHGSLALAEQRSVLQPSENPRIILTTNIAEASVTVPGVDYVIDSGLAKVMDTNPHSGFSSLLLTRIASFNARQRSGRAARQKAGICQRLWTKHEEATLLRQMSPECQRADLAQALLFLASFGVRNFESFAWLDRPSKASLEIAEKLLQRMGALTAENILTERGRELIHLPLPPDLGLFLLAAGKGASKVAALLNERDFVLGEVTTQSECDVQYRLALLDEIERGQRPGGVNLRLASTVLETAEQLERLVEVSPTAIGWRDALLKTMRHRLCKRREKTARGLMAGGRGVRLEKGTQVLQSEFFLALQGIDLPGQNETSVRLASGFQKSEILSLLRDHVVTTEDVEFMEDKGQFFARKIRRVEGLALEEPTLTPVDPSRVKDRLADILTDKFAWASSQNVALGTWCKRLRFLSHHLGQDVVAHVTRAQIHQAWTLAAFGKTSIAQILEQDVLPFFEMQLPSDTLMVMKAQAPSHFLAPSGVSHPVIYTEDMAYVDVRLQEIFGLLKTPRLAEGKVALTFRLLGPNYRPVQVTSDLENFWRSAYQEVRRELRARYPKHSWPEDPYTAKPEAKGRRRT